MSGVRSRRSAARDEDNADLYSSSLIFGNVGGGASAQQQSSSTSYNPASTPFLLDGSRGSRRLPLSSSKQSTGQAPAEYPTENQYNSTSGATKPVRSNRPPITSLLERQAGGSMDFDSVRSPNPNMMDTNRDMSTGRSPYQSDRGMGMGDMSFSPDAARFSGGFSREHAVDSDGATRGSQGSANARTFGGRYAVENDQSNAYRSFNGAANSDEGGYGSSVTPFRAREDRGDSSRSNYSAGPYPASADRMTEKHGNMDSERGMRAASSYGRMGMMIGTSSEHNGGKALNHLDASLLMWVVVSGVPLGSSSGTESSSSVSKVLMRMQAFGTVVEHRIFAGNSIVVRYSSPFEAERAVAEPISFLGTALNGHVMLSFTQLNAQIARSLGLEIDANGGLIMSGDGGDGDGQGTTSPFPTTRHTQRHSRADKPHGAGLELRGHLASREEPVSTDLYLRPPKKRAGNICSRLVEYIFSY